MKKNFIILISLSIFIKFLGFFREIVLSYFFGTSMLSDAYIVALTIPQVIFLIIGESINKTFIPTYNLIKEEIDEKASINFANQLNFSLLSFSTIIIVLILLFTDEAIFIFANGFNGEVLNLTVLLTRVSIFSIYFISMSYVFIGFLQIKGRFRTVILVSVPLNIVNILSIYLAYKYSYEILAFGQVIASLTQFLFILVFAIKAGYRFRFSLDEITYLKLTLKRSLPVIFGKSIHQLNKIVDKTLASTIQLGGVTALSYANRLSILIQTIFVNPISMVMYTDVSSKTLSHSKDEIVKIAEKYFIQILILVIPVTFGAYFLSKEIITVVYFRGQFNADSLVLTRAAFSFYILASIPVALRELQGNIFYSYGNTKTPVKNASISFVVNIALSITLAQFFGLNGIPIATSIAAYLAMVLMFMDLKKFGLQVISKSLFNKIVKLIIAASIMSMFVSSSDALLGLENIYLHLLINLSLGAVLYFIILYLLKLSEVKDLINIFSRFKRKK